LTAHDDTEGRLETATTTSTTIHRRLTSTPSLCDVFSGTASAAKKMSFGEKIQHNLRKRIKFNNNRLLRKIFSSITFSLAALSFSSLSIVHSPIGQKYAKKITFLEWSSVALSKIESLI